MSSGRISLYLWRPVHCGTKHTIMGKIGPTEIILILAVILLFFGGKKIPELMRGLGKGVREFKDASKGESGEKDQLENK
jgi:sec-independent protein translocase protein TatA